MKKNVYGIVSLLIYLVLEGCIPGERTFMEQDRYLGYGNERLPPTYQLGFARPPIPGSPELFNLPQTTEPGPYYRPVMNHFFAPTTKCLPITANIQGFCNNINFIRINESFFRSRRDLL